MREERGRVRDELKDENGETRRCKGEERAGEGKKISLI